MIFITVGGQLPFDRLIRAMDKWAKNHSDIYCFAQIGKGGWQPKYIEWVGMLSPQDFMNKLKNSDLVVSHAGMGTIISVLDLGKKLIVMPRKSQLREHRNDHQIATANRFESMGFVVYATDENHLMSLISKRNMIEAKCISSSHASNELLESIRRFII